MEQQEQEPISVVDTQEQAEIEAEREAAQDRNETCQCQDGSWW